MYPLSVSFLCVSVQPLRRPASHICHSLFNFCVYKLRDSAKIAVYFVVRYSYNQKPSRFYLFRSFAVSFFLFFFIVPSAVQLYNKLCTAAVKIGYIIAYHFLAQKPHRIFLKKIIPQVSLFLCHVLS